MPATHVEHRRNKTIIIYIIYMNLTSTHIQYSLLSFLLFSTLCLVILAPSKTQAEQTNIAVAANFTLPMKAIIEVFEKTSKHKVRLITGSSGKLFAQIQNHAPFDAFFSADVTKPTALIEANTAISSSEFTYAIGALVLWRSATSNNNANILGDLKNGHYRKLAIANPRVAPYGIAAMEVLARLELSAAATPKLVKGENIAQAYQFVASGNAQLGFIAQSQVMKSGQLPVGSWAVPAKLHQPIRQNAVLLTHGQNNSAARALLAFMRTQPATDIIHAYGYSTEHTEHKKQNTP